MLLHNSFNPKVQSIQKWLEATFASKNNFFSWPIRIRSLWIIIRKESLTNNGLKINVIWSCSLLFRKNGILLPKLFWPTMRKKSSNDLENFWNSRLKAKNLQIFEITRTIYSNSESSQQFLVTECFFDLFLEVSHIYQTRTIGIQVEKNDWYLKANSPLETCSKS